MFAKILSLFESSHKQDKAQQSQNSCQFKATTLPHAKIEIPRPKYKRVQDVSWFYMLQESPKKGNEKTESFISKEVKQDPANTIEEFYTVDTPDMTKSIDQSERNSVEEFYTIETPMKSLVDEFYTLENEKAGGHYLPEGAKLLDEKKALYINTDSSSYVDEQKTQAALQKQKSLSVPPILTRPTENIQLRDWNAEIVTFLETLQAKGCDKIEVHDWKYFGLIAHQFVDTATLYAKIIISELGLPCELKTIKPVDVGGIAGGTKYIYHNILFKFALDTQIMQNPPLYMYGGSLGPNDNFAMKSAKNELKMIEAFRGCHVSGLFLPIMAAIDYKGYRLSAISLLPVKGESTLAYGSGDGGRTVHADSADLNEKMKTAGERLNLKVHKTGHGMGKKEIYGPGDIEGHIGLDGRFYVLDFGRLMPPEDPRVRNEPSKRAVFYNLLRPEFVKQYKTPLCSDAFTNWNCDDNEEVRTRNNEEVVEATRYLYNEVIPRYAKDLDERAKEVDWKYIYSDRITKRDARCNIRVLAGPIMLHVNGINMRHLGLLRKLVQTPELKKFLLSICVSRVLKDDLKEAMRFTMMEYRVPSDEPFKKDVLSLFEKMTGTDKASQMFWQEVKHKTQHKYFECLTEEELQEDHNIVSSIDMRIVLVSLLSLTGVKIKGGTWEHLLRNPTDFQLVHSDIKSLDARVTANNMVYYADGMSYLVQAINGSQTRVNDSIRLLGVCIKKMSRASEISPTCAVIYHRWALSYHLLAQIHNENRHYNFKKSILLYERAWNLWATFSPITADYYQACDQYIQYLENDSDQQVNKDTNQSTINNLMKKKKEIEEFQQSHTDTSNETTY